MMRPLMIGTACLAAALPASAQIVNLHATLDGAQEVPPVNTPGYGFATVTLNIVTGEVTVQGQWYDLLSPINPPPGNAHIHGPAAPGVNAGVIFGLDTTGTREFGTFTGNATLSPAHVQAMLEGLTYINLHTQLFPAGEIRGQVIPAPGALWVLAAGGLLAMRRRRR